MKDLDQRAREERKLTFLAYLPPELHTMPGIEWSHLPDGIMGYLIRNVGSSPDFASLAVATATAREAMSNASLLRLLGNLHGLLLTLRNTCGMEQLSDLRQEDMWNKFAASTPVTRHRSTQLSAYSAVSIKHFPTYLHTIEDTASFMILQQFQFPPLPSDFLRKVGLATEFNEASSMHKQAIRQSLIPFIPNLCELLLLRKRLIDRMLQAYQLAQQQVQVGALLPFSFQITATIPLLSQQGTKVEIVQKESSLPFVLWTRRSWVLGHKDRYSKTLIETADKAREYYSPEHDEKFVQYVGDPLDLWFSTLIEQRLFQNRAKKALHDPSEAKRLHVASELLGFPRGCFTSLSGILQENTHWFSNHAKTDEMLFDPEALGRGVLYATACVFLVMSSGCSVNELLQVSANRWTSLPEKHQQLLLPKGAKTEQERRRFLIHPETIVLLEEIAQELEKSYGEIPNVPPSAQLSNYELLSTEQYLFQWNGSMLPPQDVHMLARFLLFDVHLTTADGKRIPISIENLRYGGSRSREEKADVLLREFGFKPKFILPHLSPPSINRYDRDFFAYWQFAGSRQAALQASTFERWIDFLQIETTYRHDTISSMVSILQHIFAEAASQGYIDENISSAFHRVKKPGKGKANPQVHFSQVFRKCGKIDCSVCRNGGKHGPYWYAHKFEDGKRYIVYVGREKNADTVARALQKMAAQRISQAEAGVSVQALPTLQQQTTVSSLASLLPQLLLLRKQLASRVFAAIGDAQHQISLGVALPVHFQVVDSIPELRFAPESHSTGTIIERKVRLSFSCWDKRSWVLGHADRFSKEIVRRARKGIFAYSDEKNVTFIQCHNQPHDILWFGKLIELHLFREIEPSKALDDEKKQVKRLARELGFPRGCHTSRAGLLDSSDRWFAEIAHNSDYIFEPRSLYRGILYGSALAILVLTCSFGISEIMQISADRWIRNLERGINVAQEGIHPQSQSYMQSLYSPEAQSEKDRSLYAIRAEAVQLLEEIEQQLKLAYDGEIPSVLPFQKAQSPNPFLRAERYLFQWQKSVIFAADAMALVRFVLHGMPMTNAIRHFTTERLQRLSPSPNKSRDDDLVRLCDILLAPLQAELAPSTLKIYHQQLLRYLRFASTPENAFQTETFAQWIGHLSRTHADTPGRRASIVSSVTPVRRILDQAVKIGLIDQPRAELIKQVRVQPHKRPGRAQQRNDTTAHKQQTHHRKPSSDLLAEDDERWIVEECSTNPGITARELIAKLEVDRGKKTSRLAMNRLRARYGVSRPRNSSVLDQRRPSSYKLQDADIAWLLRQREENHHLSGSQLQAYLKEERHIEMTSRGVNVLLRKHGFSNTRK